jgi:hypothetical protein
MPSHATLPKLAETDKGAREANLALMIASEEVP